MKPLNRSVPARRSPMGLTLVVGLHVVFVYALIEGLGLTRPLVTEPPTIDVIAQPDERPALEPPAALADPKLYSPIPVDVPVPDIPVEDFINPVPDPGPTVILPQGAGSGDVVPALIAARVDPHHPLSQPPYPPSAIRNNQEGTLTLALLVRPDGRVAEATVVRSSGVAALDAAAVLEAKRRWKLLPAMHGSAAVEGWTHLKVVFRLDQR